MRVGCGCEDAGGREVEVGERWVRGGYEVGVMWMGDGGME